MVEAAGQKLLGVVPATGEPGKFVAVELRDMDPFDFAKAERVFPESQAVRIIFRLMAKQTAGRLENDVRSGTPGNYRPVQFWFDANGHIKTPHRIHAAYQPETWYDMALDIDTAKRRTASPWTARRSRASCPSASPA